MPQHNFERPKGRLVEFTLESKALKGNLLNDPTARTIAVYLPEGYDESDADYPMFVDLAAFTGSGLKRLSWTAFGESVPQRIDRLVARGDMGPVIAVFPDAFSSLGGNQYVNSPVLGDWATLVAEELVEAVEARFRVRKGPRHRAVYGKSSGGYGALVQAMHHGERWGAVACHSGDMAFEWSILKDFPAALDALGRHGGVPQFLEHVATSPKMRGSDFHTLMTLALAASYDPDPSAPHGIRLPVDLYTCELDHERWARWLAHDPIRMVEHEACRRRLAALSGLFLDCGRRDQYFLHYGARLLSKRLEHYDIEHVYEEFDDDHSSIDYRLDVSLPFLYGAVTH